MTDADAALSQSNVLKAAAPAKPLSAGIGYPTLPKRLHAGASMAGTAVAASTVSAVAASPSAASNVAASTGAATMGAAANAAAVAPQQ